MMSSCHEEDLKQETSKSTNTESSGQHGGKLTSVEVKDSDDSDNSDGFVMAGVFSGDKRSAIELGERTKNPCASVAVDAVPKVNNLDTKESPAISVNGKTERGKRDRAEDSCAELVCEPSERKKKCDLATPAKLKKSIGSKCSSQRANAVELLELAREVVENIVRKKPGRPINPYTRLVAMLKSIQGNRLKKSYFWAYIIRRLKHLMRLILSGRKPLLVLDDWSKKWCKKMEKLVHQYSRFHSASLSTEGTISDGIYPRKHQGLPEPEFHSYSKLYLKYFYAETPIKQFHFYFVQLVFGLEKVDPEAISQKLKLRCCDGSHSEACKGIWSEIKVYLVRGMFEELELKPYTEREEAQLEDIDRKNQEEFLYGKTKISSDEEGEAEAGVSLDSEMQIEFGIDDIDSFFA